MDIFGALDRYHSNIAFITERSQKIYYSEIIHFSNCIAEKIDHRCLVFVICSNSFDCIVGYIGLMRYKIVPVLISENTNFIQLEHLLSAYQPEFIYFPMEMSKLFENTNQVDQHGSYILSKTNFKTDYDIYSELALLLTTSGSTGSPKFVRLSYHNIQSNMEAIIKYLPITSTDCAITTLPMSYTYGLSVIHTHLYQGASIVLTKSSLLEKKFWDLAKEHQVTTLNGVPYTYEILKKLKFSQLNLPNLKYITQAGGKLHETLIKEFSDICEQKKIKFFVMYGQTEATARMSYLPWEYVKIKIGSIGIPIPGGQFWIVNDDNEKINTPDVSGELVYQGDNVSLGYAKNFHDLKKTDENRGILYTGDIAQFDQDGFYYLMGRKNRYIKMYGNRINLNELELLLNKAGFECVCSGNDNQLLIYLVDKNNNISTIKKYLASLMQFNPVCTIIKCVDKIPRNTIGKVHYAALTE